jgi:hypothetical protein
MNRQRQIPSKPTLITIGIISLIPLFGIFNFSSSNQNRTKPEQPSLANSNMGIVHIVMFEFKEKVTAEEVKDVRLLARRIA